MIVAVVFLAHGVTDTTPTAGQTIIFPTIVVNEGGAYNNTSGIFTAPFKGSYSFSIQLCFYNQHSIFLSFMVENKAYSSTQFYYYYEHVCQTSEIDVHLEKNERVWLKCARVDSGFTILGESTNYYSFFSGAFIRPV